MLCATPQWRADERRRSQGLAHHLYRVKPTGEHEGRSDIRFKRLLISMGHGWTTQAVRQGSIRFTHLVTMARLLFSNNCIGKLSSEETGFELYSRKCVNRTMLYFYLGYMGNKGTYTT